MPSQYEPEPGLSPDKPNSIGSGSGTVENFDDFLEFGDPLTLGDEGFYHGADWNFQNTPPYDQGLYSTPLAWEPPKERFGEQQDKLRPTFPAAIKTLSLAQQEKLRSIAMPDNLQYSNQNSPQSASSGRTYKSSSATSPDPQGNGRKRKSSAGADDDDEDDEEGTDGQPPPIKKTAHNMIEKRYRTNLNDKIAALRDSVPSLRVMKKNVNGDGNDPKEDLHGLTPAHKLNKATVLSKATEYIRHLEKRNSRLNDENVSMKARIVAFERLFMAGSLSFGGMPPATPNHYMQDQFMARPTGGEMTPDVNPIGMIEVPDDIKRLHAVTNQVNQPTYAVPQENYRPAVNRIPLGPNGWQNTGGYFGKMMVGSLAALMILEGFSEAELEGEEPNARGLFAIPTNLLAYLGRFLRSSTDISILGFHSPSGHTLSLLRMFLVFGTLFYMFFPSMFSNTGKETKTSDKGQRTALASAPSLASPLHVRQQAWLTAIQTVWVPGHNFFLEAAALCLKMAKLSLRNTIGWYGYSLLTGITEQQEAARVKAWSIALDAQLAGGDVEINKSRLALTLLASYTLPDTPARLMLKALHIRVLMWEFGKVGFEIFPMFKGFVAKVARSRWDEAQRLQRIIKHTGKPCEGQEADQLPPHLTALLEYECDEVFVKAIAQRAYNLAFNLPAANKASDSVAGMDVVTNDFAIRSPLDATAAWFSTLKLQRVLTTSIGNEDIAEGGLLQEMTSAIKTAPDGSGAQIRAIVARAVLFDSERSKDIASAVQFLSPADLHELGGNKAFSTFINNTTSVESLPDLRMSLSCAIAIAHLQRSSSPLRNQRACQMIKALRPVHLSLLGFTAAMKLMEALLKSEDAMNECRLSLENLAGVLRIWAGGPAGLESELSQETKESLVDRCLEVTKHCVGIEEDAGYESMSDVEAK